MVLKAKEELAGFVRTPSFYSLGFRDKQWAISIVRCKQIIVGQPMPKVLIYLLLLVCLFINHSHTAFGHVHELRVEIRPFWASEQAIMHRVRWPSVVSCDIIPWRNTGNI